MPPEKAERIDAHRAKGGLPFSGRAIRAMHQLEGDAFRDGQCAAVTWLETEVYGGTDPLQALLDLRRSLDHAS
jgi:hypothetical protein